MELVGDGAWERAAQVCERELRVGLRQVRFRLLDTSAGNGDVSFARLRLEQLERFLGNVVVGLRLGQIGLAGEQVAARDRAQFEELAATVVDLLRLIERGFGRSQLPAPAFNVGGQSAGRRLLQIGLGIGECRRGFTTRGDHVTALERGKHVTRFHTVPLVNSQIADGAGDPRRNAGLLSREDGGGRRA